MESLDFSQLTDDQLITLIQAAVNEAVRRGAGPAEAARAAGLDAAEKARIAAEATARAKEKLKAEEAARIAREAEAKLRADKELDQAAKLRGLAVRARELFGSDVVDFSVKIWARGADKRVYIGGGYGSNWVEYHHTGSARTAPGTISVGKNIVAPLAEHLGVTQDEAQSLITSYCRSIATDYSDLALEVSQANAPVDPAAVRQAFAVSGPWYLDGSKPGRTYARSAKCRDYVTKFEDGKHFGSESEAIAAIPELLTGLIEDVKAQPLDNPHRHSDAYGEAEMHDYMARLLAAVTIESRTYRTAFAPKSKGGA